MAGAFSWRNDPRAGVGRTSPFLCSLLRGILFFENFHSLFDAFKMLLVGHAWVSPAIKQSAGQFFTFRAGFEAFLIDRAVKKRAYADPKIFQEKRFAFAVITASAAFLRKMTAAAIHSAW